MFHSIHCRKAIALASGLVGLTALSIPVTHAEDGKVYPAAMCEGALVGNPPIISYTGESVRNNSTTNSAVVVCAGIKDNVLGTTGLNEAYVRYYKANTTGFLCDLHSMNAHATAEYVQFKSDFGAAGFKTFSFTPIASYANGHYSLICVIPPSATATKHELFSYRLDEN